MSNNHGEESPNSQTVKAAMEALLEILPRKVDSKSIELTAPRRSKLVAATERLLSVLQQYQLELDPVRQPSLVFDPSDPATIGILIAKTLLAQPRIPLTEIAGSKFYGSGVYAIYYNGDFDAYGPVSKKDTPLYVGKVDPKFPTAYSVKEQGMKLYDRLNGDHARSIKAATNLNIEDFDCRYLVVKSAWQGTAETYLIDQLKPIWNNEVGICYGIGKHGDSAKTRSNKRSPWDTLHPGRSWAWKQGNVPNEFSADQIKIKIAEHFRIYPPGSISV